LSVGGQFMITCASLYLILATATGPIAAVDQKHAAVLEFELGPHLQKEIDRIYFSDRARSALHDSAPNLFVMTRESTESLLEANGTTMADCTGQCEVEIGRKLGADYIISGRITRISRMNIAITMRLFATGTGELLSSAEDRGRNADDLQNNLDGALAKLFSPLGVSSSAATIQMEAPAVAANSPTQPTPADHAISSGTVDIVVGSTLKEDLVGATITIDGRAAGIAPASLQLAPGEHFIQTAKDLYISGKIRLVVKPNEIYKATFDLRPDFATVTITSEPDGSVITIDGISAGRTPLKTLRLKTGQHNVVAEYPDYVSARVLLIAKPAESTNMPLKLSPDFGSLRVTSLPNGAEVLIDGKSVGRTPLDMDKVKAGQHVLEVKGDALAYSPWRRTVQVLRATTTEPIEASLSRREAYVIIASQPPGANVFVDGYRAGQTSLKLKLLGGQHELRTTLDGYAPQTQTIQIVPPDSMRVQVQLHRGGSGPNHRFTVADLDLQYRSPPPPPVFLPTTREIKSAT
jgi:hypothetical protein